MKTRNKLIREIIATRDKLKALNVELDGVNYENRKQTALKYIGKCFRDTRFGDSYYYVYGMDDNAGLRAIQIWYSKKHEVSSVQEDSCFRTREENDEWNYRQYPKDKFMHHYNEIVKNFNSKIK